MCPSHNTSHNTGPILVAVFITELVILSKLLLLLLLLLFLLLLLLLYSIYNP